MAPGPLLVLGRDVHEASALEDILRPFPADRMEAYPVSSRVNDPRNDDPACVEPEAA